MRILFAGTPELAVPALAQLSATHVVFLNPWFWERDDIGRASSLLNLTCFNIVYHILSLSINVHFLFFNNFKVGFWGTFIPLQGIEYIVKAAKLLEPSKDINFQIIGDGQTFDEVYALAQEMNIQNVKFLKKIFKINELARKIQKFDIGLGIFGESEKTKQVIPNKIFEGIATRMPMISAETPAIKELFVDEKNILLCERSNADSLAKAILKLKKNSNLRKKIAKKSYELFRNSCTSKEIGKMLIYSLNKYIKNYYKT